MKTKRQNPIEKAGVELFSILVIAIFAFGSIGQIVVAQDIQKNSDPGLESGDLCVRIELADAELNLLYGKVLAKMQKEEAESLKVEQREWLKRMGQAPSGSAERLDYLLSRNQHLREFLTKPSGDPPKSFTSPDGRSTVRILNTPMPGKTEDSEEQWTLEVLRGSDSILKVATYGYLLSCKWSADGNFVAINNRRANSGDYVWVVDMEARKIVKKPDDELGQSWSRKAMPHEGDADSVDRSWIVAQCWEKNGHLRYRVVERMTGKIETVAAEGVHEFERSRAAVTPLSPKDDKKVASSEVLKGLAANKNEIVCDGQIVKKLRFRYLDDGPKLLSGGPSTEIVVRLFAWKMPIVPPKGSLDASPKEIKIERGKAVYAKNVSGIPEGEKLFPVRVTFMPWRLNPAAPEGFTVQVKLYYYKNEFDKWDYFEE